MAIRSKLLSVPVNTVAGSQVVTGVGFAPEVIIGMVADMTGAGGASNHNFGIFGIGGTSKGALMGVSSEDGVTMDCGASSYEGNNPGFRLVTYDGQTLVSGNLTTFDADGVTLNIVTAPPTAYLLHLLFLANDSAGTSILSAMGVINCNTIVGTQDVTGLGFTTPDVVIFLQGFGRTGGPQGANNISINGTIGFAAGNTQAANIIYEGHGSNPADTKGTLRTDRCAQLQGNTSTMLSVSYVPGVIVTDGFRININTTWGSAWKLGYIALKNVGARVLNVVSSTGTGLTAVTGAGFTPSAIIGITAGTQVETVQEDARWGVGFATSPTARVGISFAARDAIFTPASVSEKLSTTSLLTSLQAAHGAPTDIDRWDIASISTDGFTYDHELASGAATKMAFLVFGGAVASNQVVTPTGIASAQVFGTPTLFSGSSPQTITVTGIPSAQAFGTPVVGGAKIIQPIGIKSADYRNVELTGTFDDVAFDPQFTQYKVELTTGPDPRSAFVPFGTPTSTFLQVAPGSYVSRWSLSNAAGTVLANTQTDTIVVTNVGTPTLVVGGGPGAFVIAPAGIPSAQSFGNPFINMAVLPTGIPTAEAFGNPTMTTGGLAILPLGIPTAEAFGTPAINVDNLILPVGIATGEEFGVPSVEFEGSQIITVSGIETGEAFGTATVAVPIAPPTQWPPIEDPHTVWIRIPRGREG